MNIISALIFLGVIGTILTNIGESLQHRFSDDKYPYVNLLAVIVEAIGIVTLTPVTSIYTIIRVIARIIRCSIIGDDIYVGRRKYKK